MFWIWIAAAFCWTGTRLPFGQRPSRCCVIWSKIPAVLFRRTSSLPRSGRIWPSPTMRSYRASANCDEALGDDGPRLIKTDSPPRLSTLNRPCRSLRPPIVPSVTDATPDLVASHDGARALKPRYPGACMDVVGDGAHRLAQRIVRRSRSRGFACCRGTVGRSPLTGDFLGTPHSGEQFSKTAELAAKPAIAILPFVNQSDDSAREYFADGLTQDIINALGRFPDLTVMSWNAVFPYKGRPANPAEIARNLAVRYQVEGKRPPNRRSPARERATRGHQWPGALVCQFRRGACGCLFPARQDHHSDRRDIGDPRFAGRTTACVRKADRKSRGL